MLPARALGPGGQVVLVDPADGIHRVHLQGADGLGHIKDVLVGGRGLDAAVGALPVNGLPAGVGPSLHLDAEGRGQGRADDCHKIPPFLWSGAGPAEGRPRLKM